MAKPRISDPIVRNRDVKEALGSAFTRALHWAPEPLLQEFTGERRVMASRRLAIRVRVELAADGWVELRPRLDLPDIEDAIVAGMKKAGKTMLRSLPSARCCDGKLLDCMGLHFGELTFDAMRKLDVLLQQTSTPPPVNIAVYRQREAG